jgi:hypothetical protein
MMMIVAAKEQLDERIESRADDHSKEREDVVVDLSSP